MIFKAVHWYNLPHRIVKEKCSKLKSMIRLFSHKFDRWPLNSNKDSNYNFEFAEKKDNYL